MQCNTQVAAQQGKYLAKMFNTNSQLFPRNSCTDVTTSGDCAQAGANNSLLDQVPPFKYTHLGSMASVGEWKGVIDTPNNCECCLHWLFGAATLSATCTRSSLY